MAQFEAIDTRIIGVSKDSLASHGKFRAKHGFTFPLLSDPDHEMLEAYGAWGEKKNYGKVSMGTLRSTVVVGPDGVVEKVYTKVKAKGHAQAVLEELSAG